MSSWFPHFYAPRKRAATIHTVYIADGFADDCEELIHRCCQAGGTLNFNIFSNIWKDMNFAWIFQSRPSGAEIAELAEEVILVAKRYLVQNTTNFEETVASLFLVYSLVHLQPIQGFAPLRILPEDVDAIFRIQAMARQQHRHDVLYILASLLVNGPCQFHVGEREYGMDTGVRKYFDSITSIDKYGTRPKGVFYRQTEELDLLRELSSLGRRYARAKIFNNNAAPDRTLRYTDEHLPNEIAASLKQLIDGDITGSKSQAAALQSIKERAMWQQIQEMRHLKQLPDGITKKKLARVIKNRRRDDEEGSVTSETKSKKKDGKNNTKTGSPNKSPPKKRKIKQPYNYKKSLASSNPSDSDSDISISSSDIDNDTNDFDTNDDLTADETDAEVQLNNLDSIDDYINRMKSLTQTVKSDNAQPSTSDSNIQYEIEIIDYMQDGRTDINNTKIQDPNPILNKKEKIAATKSKPNLNKVLKKKTLLTDVKKNTERDESEQLDTVQKVWKPAYNKVVRKGTDHKSPLGRGPKGRVKASKCEPAINMDDTSSIDLLPPTQSLPELVVVEIAEEDGGVSENTGCAGGVVENSGCSVGVVENSGCSVGVVEKSDCVVGVVENSGCSVSVVENSGCSGGVSVNSGCSGGASDNDGITVELFVKKSGPKRKAVKNTKAVIKKSKRKK